MASLLHTRPNWPSARSACVRSSVYCVLTCTAPDVLREKACCIIGGALIYRRDKDSRPRYNPVAPRCPQDVIVCPFAALDSDTESTANGRPNADMPEQIKPRPLITRLLRAGKPNPRATSTVNTQAFTRLVRGRRSRKRISESFGETPSDYVFDIFAAFARTIRVIELRFFFTFCSLRSCTWFSWCETERPDTGSEEQNLQRNRIACKDNPPLVRPCVIYYVLQ